MKTTVRTSEQTGTGDAVVAASAQRQQENRRRPRLGNLRLRFVIGAVALACALLQPALFVVGLVVGSVYAVGTYGLTLSWKILGFPNIAHTMLMVTGGYVAYLLYSGGFSGDGEASQVARVGINLGALPGARDPQLGLSFGYGLPLALIVAIPIGGAVAILADSLVFRRFRRRARGDFFTLTIASFGVAYVATGIVSIMWGIRPQYITSALSHAHHLPGGVRLNSDQIFVLVAAGLLAAGAHIVLFRTSLGRLLRATGDNPQLARVSGIETERLIRVTWLLVGCLTFASGALYALLSPISPAAAVTLLLPILTATILGGIGSPAGALIAGLFVGVVQETSVAYLDPGYKVPVSFIVAVAVLLLAPQGLFGASDDRP